MQCNICHKNEATIYLEGTVNGKAMFLHLCEDCANNKGIEFSLTKPHFSLVDLLANLSDWEIPGHKTSKSVTCPDCGLAYSKFKETARLGCSKCYESFALQLAPLLKRIHGSNKHKGKKPKPIISLNDTIIFKLKTDLSKAIESEQYEEAAKIRDKIKEAQKEGLNIKKEGN